MHQHILSSPEEHVTSHLAGRPLVYALIGITCVFSVAVLLGWTFHIEYLIALGPDLAVMVPSTATLLILSAGGLLLKLSWPQGNLVPLVWLLCALVVAVASLDQILFYDSGTGLDGSLIDELRGSADKRMSTMTATCFVMFSVSLFLQSSKAREAQYALIVCASIGLVIAAIGLIGHVFDASAFYAVSVFRAMSLQTSIAFFLLFLAILLSRQEIGWMAIFLNDGPGSRNARHLVAPIIIIPLGLCFVALLLSNHEVLQPNFILSLVAIIMIAAFLVALLVLAANQNRAHRAQTVLIDRLTQTIADRDVLLSEVYHRVKNNLQQINALLFVQSRTLTNQEAKNALVAMSGRIESLGVVQSLLLESPTIDHLNTRAFLGELSRRLEHALGGGLSHIRIETDVVSRKISLDAAITLGLLVNEFVSNAFKHAFTRGENSESAPGVIAVQLEKTGSQYILTISDNGTGLDGAQDRALPKGGSGSEIIGALTGQLGGEINISSNNGMTARIVFPGDRLEPAE